MLPRAAEALRSVDGELPAGGEVPARQDPRGPWERLAEEVVEVAAAAVEEEDAVGEERVEEAGGDGEDAVAEARVWGPHEVSARGIGSVVAGGGGVGRRAKALDGARVGEGAGAAEAVEGLVPAEGGDEVRRERVQRRPAVPRGAVAAEAGAIVEVRREEAAQGLLLGSGTVANGTVPLSDTVVRSHRKTRTSLGPSS